MAEQHWRDAEKELTSFQGRPTQTYSRVLNDTAGNSGPFQLVDFVQTWCGCIVWADGTAGGFFQFVLNSQFGGARSQPMTVLIPNSRGPFLLTPGTGLSVFVIPGAHGGANPTVNAIVWEDPQTQIIMQQLEVIRLIKEQNATNAAMLAALQGR